MLRIGPSRCPQRWLDPQKDPYSLTSTRATIRSECGMAIGMQGQVERTVHHLTATLLTGIEIAHARNRQCHVQVLNGVAGFVDLPACVLQLPGVDEPLRQFVQPQTRLLSVTANEVVLRDSED